jgi:hypothetical protein
MQCKSSKNCCSNSKIVCNYYAFSLSLGMQNIYIYFACTFKNKKNIYIYTFFCFLNYI